MMAKRFAQRAPVFLVLLLLLLAMPGAAAWAQTPQPDAAASAPAADEPTAAPTAGDEPAPTGTTLLEGIVETRTPEPTATPGPIEEGVEQIARATGVYRVTVLGLSGTDWINLAVSLLMLLIGYALGTLLIRGLLPKAVRRTPSPFDDRLLQAIGPDLRWLVVVLVASFATTRLTFLSAEVKAILNDIYFVLGLAIGLHATWKLISLAAEWYRQRLAAQDRLEQLDPVIVLLDRTARIVATVSGLMILLSHFGVNVTAFSAALGIGGLALSLAAKDTIADAIAGFIILVDQPFRIGDRIEIQGVGTWGDVVDIGLRTTRIRTRDNRLVIVPNSTIGSNQVINYTYPDPQYRIETHVGIAYGTDIETARQILIDAVRQVEGVLADKPVDALYIEMGDSAMIFRVRWWIESYGDTRQMYDQVHTALQERLDEAGIECPFPTQTFNLQVEQAAGPSRPS